MPRRTWSILLLSTTAIGILLWVWLCAPKEPVYKGRKLSDWVQDLNLADGQLKQAAQHAVLEIGEPGVPFLIAVLEEPRSLRFRAQLFLEKHQLLKAPKNASYWRSMKKENAWRALELLGPRAKTAIPSLIEDARDGRSAPADVLGAIGSNAVPQLVRALEDKDDARRRGAAHALSRISGDVTLTPIFIQNLKHPDPAVRAIFVHEMGLRSAFDTQTVVRVAMPLLRDPSGTVRLLSLAALVRRTGAQPETVGAAWKLLADPDNEVREEAAISVAQIDPASARTNPAVLAMLANNMTNETWHVPSRSAEALARLGTNAAPAVPAMVAAFQRMQSYKHQPGRFAEYSASGTVLEALRVIDPHTAAILRTQEKEQSRNSGR